MSEKKKTSEEDLELKLLKAELELLKGKISKPQTSEEEFQARVEAYESKKSEREALQQKIDKRRMEIMQQPEFLGKIRYDEAILLEAWERRYEQVKIKHPHFANRIMAVMRQKKKDIIQDPMR